MYLGPDYFLEVMSVILISKSKGKKMKDKITNHCNF